MDVVVWLRSLSLGKYEAVFSRLDPPPDAASILAP